MHRGVRNSCALSSLVPGVGEQAWGVLPPHPTGPTEKDSHEVALGACTGKGYMYGVHGQAGGAGRGGCTGKGCIDMEVVHVQGASPLWVKSVPNPCCSRGAAASVGAQGPAERHISLLAGTLSSAKGLGQRLLPLAMGDQGDGSDGE